MLLRDALRALRHAMEEENFGSVLATAASLVVLGTITYALGAGWNIIDSLYFAVSTLTTANVNDPALVLEDRGLKLFTIVYQLVGIGMFVEVLRRMGAAYVAVREAPAASSEPPRASS